VADFGTSGGLVCFRSTKVAPDVRMSTKSDAFMRKAANCDRLAELAKEPAARNAFTEAAAQWRRLARQATMPEGTRARSAN
jgi:hypothetical protein